MEWKIFLQIGIVGSWWLLTPPVHGAPPPASEPTEGTYYLTESIGVLSKTGVRRTLPGSQVVLREALPKGFRVRTEDGTEFEVTPKQLTQDYIKATQLAARERAKQDALNAWLKYNKASVAAHDAKSREEQRVWIKEYQRLHPDALNPGARSAPINHPWRLTGTALDEKARKSATVHHPKTKGRKKSAEATRNPSTTK